MPGVQAQVFELINAFAGCPLEGPNGHYVDFVKTTKRADLRTARRRHSEATWVMLVASS